MKRPVITFSSFALAPKIYEAAAVGTADDAGVAHEFDVFDDGEVRLWRDDRKIRAEWKLARRAAILDAHRLAIAERAAAFGVAA